MKLIENESDLSSSLGITNIGIGFRNLNKQLGNTFPTSNLLEELQDVHYADDVKQNIQVANLITYYFLNNNLIMAHTARMRKPTMKI